MTDARPGEAARRLGLRPAPPPAEIREEPRPAADQLVCAARRVLGAPVHHLSGVTLIRVPAASWLALAAAVELVDEERRGPRLPEVT